MSSNRPMKQSTQTEKENRLNETARRWKSNGPSDSERITLGTKVWELAFALFDDGTEAFVNAFKEACGQYDPAQGEFSHFLLSVLKKRRIDAYRAENRHAPDAVSLDVPISEENDLTPAEVIADPNARNPGEITRLDEKMMELTAMILNFAQRHGGRGANEVRRRWYRMFYTEDMTWVAKEGCAGFQREREVFTAMELDYLDYYMVKECRCLEAIRRTALKPYHAVVPTESSTERTPIPLPADVSLAYWERCLREKRSASARSQQLGYYREELENL